MSVRRSDLDHQDMTSTQHETAAWYPYAGPPIRRPSRPGLIAAGVLAIFGGIAAVPVSLLGMLVTANSCGMFADSCDTYGQPAAGFEWFGALFFAAPVAVIVGIVLCVLGRALK